MKVNRLDQRTIRAALRLAIDWEEPRRPRVFCMKGLHRMEGENIRIDGAGNRMCGACYNARHEAYKARLREKTAERRAAAKDNQEQPCQP